MDEQQRVAAFVAEHDLQGEPAFRILDLATEVGEIAADATESTDWGMEQSELGVATDEALAKYEARIDETGSASSGG